MTKIHLGISVNVGYHGKKFKTQKFFELAEQLAKIDRLHISYSNQMQLELRPRSL